MITVFGSINVDLVVQVPNLPGAGETVLGPGYDVTPGGKEVHAVLAEFATPADVYHAAEKVRDAGFKRWDVHTPFPIHGLEQAMGIPRTILPLISGSIGLGGAAFGLVLQWWITRDYPIVVQGKPFAAWEPFTPVTFELGILHCAFATLIGMLALNGLPRWHHPIFNSERFLKCTLEFHMLESDCFVFVIVDV